jgi:hypothetical protein
MDQPTDDIGIPAANYQPPEAPVQSQASPYDAAGGYTMRPDKGMRMNNPGNLGLSPGLGPGAEQSFNSPEEGVAAIGKQLDRYHSGQTTGIPLRTVNDIVSTYSPPNENDTPALIQRASAHLGVGPNDPIDLTDPDTRRKMVEATLLNEHGGVMPVTREVLDNALPPAGSAAGQPMPPPSTGPASGPRNIGPYSDFGAAWQAQPKNAQDYELLRQGDGWTWAPRSKADTNPAINPAFNFDQGNAVTLRAHLDASPTTSDELTHLVSNVGPTFLSGVAGSLDLPVTLVQKGASAIGHLANTEKLDFNWGTPAADWMKRHDWNTTPLYDKGWGAAIGSGIGYGVGSALPYLAVGAIAEPFVGSSALAMQAAKWLGRPGASIGNFVNETAAAASAGIGGQEAHEFYKSATGREGDLGDFVSQIVGGGVFNLARIGAAEAFLKTAGGAWAMKYNTATGAGKQLDAVSGQALADQALGGNLQSKLNEAEHSVSIFSRAPTSESAVYKAEQSQLATRAVEAFANGSRNDEIALNQLINRDIPRSFTDVKAAWSQMKQDHFSTEALNDPKDWPKQFDSLLGSARTAEPMAARMQGQVGPSYLSMTTAPEAEGALHDIDTLGRGHDVRTRLTAQIEKELSAKDVNETRVGYLQKARNLLVNTLESGEKGATPEEIQQYQMASMFSNARSKIMESPEMRSFLKSGDSSALKSLLRTGTEGSDAANILLGASQAKYGSEGLLGAAKDTLRQEYTDAVAPHGYVSLADHDRFMKSWGATLNRPAFEDVAQQFNAAAAAERNVNAVVSVGRPGGFGTASTAADARVAAAANYLQAPTAHVVDYLEGLTSPQLAAGRVVDQLQEGWKGPLPKMGTDPQQGVQHVLAQRALDDVNYVKKNLALFQAFDKVNPGFSQAAASLSDPKQMAGIFRWVKDVTASRVGAGTLEALGMGGGSHGLMMAQRGAAAGRDILNSALNSAGKLTSAAIVDPDLRAGLGRLSGLSGKGSTSVAQKAADILLMHSYVPGFVGLNLSNSAAAPGSGAPGAPLRTDAAGNTEGSPAWWHALAQSQQGPVATGAAPGGMPAPQHPGGETSGAPSQPGLGR